MTSDLAERTRQIEAIQTRYNQGDGLDGRHEIAALLAEIYDLSERALTAESSNPPDNSWFEWECLCCRRPVHVPWWRRWLGR